MEDDDGRPFLAVAFLVGLRGADGVGQESPGRSVDDLAGHELRVAGELGGLAAAPGVPAGEAVGAGRAGEKQLELRGAWKQRQVRADFGREIARFLPPA